MPPPIAERLRVSVNDTMEPIKHCTDAEREAELERMPKKMPKTGLGAGDPE